MSLRDFDLFIQGRQRRERADYRQLATLAFWLGSYFSKRPTKPDKLMGDKSGTASDAMSAIAAMSAQSKKEDAIEVINLDEVVTFDLLGEAPLDDWYWTEDNEEGEER